MKSKLLFFLLSICTQVNAQQFLPQDTLILTDVKNSLGRWVDLNQDTVFELLLYVHDTHNQTNLLQVSNDLMTIDTLEITTNELEQIEFADIDNDNDLDIVTRTTSNYIMIHYQIDSLSFSSQQLADDALYFTINDFNRDGLKDIVIHSNESNAVVIYEQNGSDTWSLEVTEMILEEESVLSTSDLSNKGYPDLLFSNPTNALSVRMNFGRHFARKDSNLFKGPMNYVTHGDLDHDGYTDHLLATNNSSLRILTQENDTTIQVPLNAKYMTIADFNSDGLADIYMHLEDGTNSVAESAGDLSFAIHSINQTGQIEFADLDYDGDLDGVAMYTIQDTLNLTRINNRTSSLNMAPSIVPKHVGFQLVNRVELFWEAAQDDHTSDSSLTYDVFVGKNNLDGTYLAPDFQLDELHRMQVIHGNAGFTKSIPIHGLVTGVYDYGIQSIDNAYHFLDKHSGDKHSGGCAYGQLVVCENAIVADELEGCVNEIIHITPNQESGWYSTAKGFLGFHSSYSYRVEQNIDTLYVNPINNLNCEDRSIYIIRQKEFLTQHIDDKIVCKGDSLTLTSTISFDSVEWKLTNDMLLSSQTEYEFLIEGSFQLIFEGYKASCTVKDTINIEARELKVTASPERAKIQKGDKIQLNAVGAMNYQWSPANTLDDPYQAYPIASPLKSTLYTVTGYDSLGCEDTATVMIEVFEDGFLPDMFTPNGDQNNDYLIVYGLSNITDFSFAIYNRNGSEVYYTENIQQASSTGWNGNKNGVKQPAGVYYWQIRGSTSAGKPATLNGKSSGLLYLIR